MENIKATSNWTQIGGIEFSKTVSTRLSEEDVFVKPCLDDLLDENRAILLCKPKDDDSPCELQFEIFPRFKIAAISVILSAPKVEVFLGSVKEYWRTIYGDVIEDDAENSENVDAIPPSYRYDIEILRSGIVDITIKLLTPANEICIYGSMLHVAPNPNGITTLMPSTINMDNVQEMLKNKKLSESAVNCKQFFETYKQSLKISSPAVSTSPFDSNLKLDHIGVLKNYIDEKFNEMNSILLKRFDSFEAQHTEKLNRILELLENDNKK